MHVRLFCAAVALSLMPGASLAQQGLRSASLPDRTPVFPIPPPPIDLFVARSPFYPPRPLVFSGPGRIGHDGRGRWTGGRRGGFGRHRGFDGYGGTVGGFGAYGGYGYAPFYADENVAREMREPEMAPNGYLYLEMRPGNAEVRVDGMYMGTVDDFRRLIPGHPLEAGPHRVELRAPGYETVTFDVRIAPQETVTYRTDLPSAAAAAAPRQVAPAAPKTFYVIPGCYAGDKPPDKSRLPARCDVSKLRKVPPVPVVASGQRSAPGAGS